MPSLDSKRTEAPWSFWRVMLLCSTAIMPQIGWAVGDMLIVPYLTHIGVPTALTAGVVFVDSLLGFAVQPLVGKFSAGRRKYALIVLHLCAFAGLSVLVFAERVYEVAEDTLITPSHFSLLVIGVVCASFSIVDISWDTLMLPSRALLNDHLPESQVEYGNVIFNNCSIIGGLLGLAVVAVPFDTFTPFVQLGLNRCSASYLVCILCLLPSLYSIRYLPAENSEKIAAAAAAKKEEAEQDDDDEEEEEEEEEEEDEEKTWLTELSEIRNSVTSLPPHLLHIWVTQCLFYWCMLCMQYYWSSWIIFDVFGLQLQNTTRASAHTSVEQAAEQSKMAAAMQLAVWSQVGVYASTLVANLWVERINEIFDPKRFYYLSVMMFSLLVACAGMFATGAWAVLFVGFMSGIVNAAVFINPYTILESFIMSRGREKDGDAANGAGEVKANSEPSLDGDSEESDTSIQDDVDVEELRGILTAMFNLTLTVGQIVMSMTAGFMIHAWDGHIWPVLAIPGFIVAAVALWFLIRSKALVEDEKEADRVITRDGLQRLKLMPFHSVMRGRRVRPGQVLVDEGSDDDEVQYEYFKRLYPQRNTRNRLETRRLMRIRTMLLAARPNAAKQKALPHRDPAKGPSPSVWTTKYQAYHDSGTSDSDVTPAPRRGRSNSVDSSYTGGLRARHRLKAERVLARARRAANFKQSLFKSSSRVPLPVVRGGRRLSRSSRGTAHSNSTEKTPLLP